MEEVISTILDLQSPFRWTPLVRDENRFETELEEEDAGTFSFLNFCTRIVLMYDGFVNQDKILAYKLLEDVDEHLKQLEESNCQDELYTKIKDAIYHVFFACKTHMAIRDGKNVDDEISQWIEKVKKFDDMNASNKAAIYAIKAFAHSLFNNDGLDTSLSQINMALSYDKTTAYWVFMRGMILQKLRSSNEVPTLLERESFDEAYKSNTSNPSFMVYFADSLRESCKHRPKTYLWYIAQSAQINAEHGLNEKYETALELYRKSYELRPNCPVIAFKCAYGLMRLPQKYQNVKLIKKIISDCEKKFPNSGFGNLVCALYHQRISKKVALSRRCLEKCVEKNVFQGFMNSIRIDFLEKKEDADVVERLVKMLDVFSEATKREIIISQIISFYVFVTADIEKACEYMLEYYRKKTSGHYLEKHQSCFKTTDGPVSLVNVITDEVKMKLRDRRLPKEKRKFFNDFVRQMSFHNIEVLKGNPKNLLEQINKSAAPKGRNPNKPHANEAERNSSAQRTRQSNDRAGYAPKNGDRRREDVLRDGGRSVSGENVSRNDSPRRRDDRHPENRRIDPRSASFNKLPDRRFGAQNSNSENARRNNGDARRPRDYRSGDNRPESIDKRPNRGFREREASAENVPRNDSGAGKSDSRRSDESGANLPRASSGKGKAPVKTKTTKSDSNSDLQLLMEMCREGDRDNLDAIFEKWKVLSLKDSGSRSEVPHTVPEEYDRRPGRAGEAPEEIVSKGRSRRPEIRHTVPEKYDRRPVNRTGEVSEEIVSGGRSRRPEIRHTVPEECDRRPVNRGEIPEEIAYEGRGRRSEDRSLEARRRDRSQSEAKGHSHRREHRHREANVNELPDVTASEDRSRRSEDRHRDRSQSETSHRSRKKEGRHRKHKKHRRSSASEDERRNRSASPSRRHRRRSEDRHSHKSHWKHRSSESSDLEGSVVAHSSRSHRKHRKSESGSDQERSKTKSHRKHRNSESVSGSERSVARKRDKRKHSHHRSKKHSSVERHREDRRSHRDREKSRRKESKKGSNSDSESGDSR